MFEWLIDVFTKRGKSSMILKSRRRANCSASSAHAHWSPVILRWVDCIQLPDIFEPFECLFICPSFFWTATSMQWVFPTGRSLHSVLVGWGRFYYLLIFIGCRIFLTSLLEINYVVNIFEETVICWGNKGWPGMQVTRGCMSWLSKFKGSLKSPKTDISWIFCDCIFSIEKNCVRHLIFHHKIIINWLVDALANSSSWRSESEI